METQNPDVDLCVVVVNYCTPTMLIDCLETLVPQVRELDARVTGVGSIDYYGSPSVTSSVTGIGSISSRGEA